MTESDGFSVSCHRQVCHVHLSFAAADNQDILSLTKLLPSLKQRGMHSHRHVSNAVNIQDIRRVM